VRPCWTVLALVVALAFSPSTLSAQTLADLAVENFSGYSTTPDPDGQHRVAISFRVVNRGTVAAPASRARVTVSGSVTEYAVPALPPAVAVFISRTFATTSAQLAIVVQADALGVVNETNKLNNKVQYAANPGGDYGRWQSIGPSKIQKSDGTLGVGRVTTIAVDSRNPGLIYAGARGSGLWKGSDNGPTWLPITDSLPSTQIDAVALDTGNSDRVVVATPAGVFESIDGGQVWTMLDSENLKASGSDGGALLVGVGGGGIRPTMYLTSDKGLRVSTDGGHTWPVVLSGGPATSVQFENGNQSKLYAAISSPAPAVFEAKDRGLTAASWHQLKGCPDAPFPMFPASSTVWITQAGDMEYISFRAGAVDNKQLGLWRTTSRTCQVDGWPEHAWVEVPLHDNCASKFENHWSYVYAMTAVPSVVFKGGIALCRSSNFGDGMGEVGNIHADQHAIVEAPSQANTIYFGSDGGIYRSTDRGQSLSFIGEGLNNTEFLKIDTDGKDPMLVIGGSQDNGTSYWTGASPIWNYIGGGDSALVAFDRADLRGLYETGQSMRQMTRYQPGDDPISMGDASLPDCCAYSENPGQVFDSMVSTGSIPRAALTCHGIWFGPPWKQIQPTTGQVVPPPEKGCDGNNSGDFTFLKLGPGGFAVAATNTGHVFYGLYKQPPLADVFHSDTATSPLAVSFLNANTFYVAMNGSTNSIFRLQCFAGCTHEDAWSHDPAGAVLAVTVEPGASTETLLAAVENQGVFRGTRSAAGIWSWTPYNNGMPAGVRVTDLEVKTPLSVVAATYGRGAFLLNTRPPGPVQQTAKGHVTSFTMERVDPDRPPGPNNPIMITATLDSKPGALFTTTKASASGILGQAFKNHRMVIIVFTGGQNGGTIISSRYAG
jgi:hypothetical protein